MAPTTPSFTPAASEGNALVQWGELLSSQLHAMAVSAPSAEAFSAQLLLCDLGIAQIGAGTGSAQVARRTREHIARSPVQRYVLLQSRSHAFHIRQYGRELLVRPGQCALYDTKEPYKVSFPTQLDCLGISVGQDWLARWRPHPEDIVARSQSDSCWAEPLGAMVRALAQVRVDELALPADVVLDQLGALIALAAEPARAHARPADKLAGRIRADLRARCQDPALTPDQLASSHRISKRYLHLLLSRSGTSFGEELMAARLALAERLLRRPDCAEQRIIDIAMHCGFTAPGHFSRRFRASYGASPSEYRARLRCQRVD